MSRGIGFYAFFALLLACSAMAVNPPVPKAERFRIAAAQVADTVIYSATWTNPADDGRGAVDSVRVTVHGILLDTTVVFRPPLATSWTVRQVVPLAAYQVGGSATWSIVATSTTYRRATNSVPVISATVKLTLNDPPPGQVIFTSFGAVKRP